MNYDDIIRTVAATKNGGLPPKRNIRRVVTKAHISQIAGDLVEQSTPHTL